MALTSSSSASNNVPKVKTILRTVSSLFMRNVPWHALHREILKFERENTNRHGNRADSSRRLRHLAGERHGP